ncbi:hypothetical protein [Bacteriovorax sp. DB6_IX]|uniref:hypothetical protein n=1 Tax=Bacteriovorax sp. DB6_IX TaxID=1353530 RepID=UPI00038A55A9|nr:hypothetical protein [Bacteriovorax sp. DB6_IX]EQC51744.1 hypothetical protein M901_1932 [Bacteriovorax sp. DB6_IX]
MKALMSTILFVSVLNVMAGEAVKINVESRSTNGKVILMAKNPTSSSLFCVSKVSTEGYQNRKVASSQTYEFSAYESKSIILDSNEGEVTLKDVDFNCVKR